MQKVTEKISRRSESTEFAAEDFAGDGFGEVIDDFDGAGVFVGGHAGFAEGDDVVWRGCGAGFEADDGFDGFAAIGVGDADDGGFAHGGVGVEHVFDVAGPDFVAGGVDHVFFAIDQIEPACLVHEADIAGVQAAIADGFGGFVWFVPVAGDDHRAGGHNFADLADRDRVARIVANP